jgi:hypothetical protein
MAISGWCRELLRHALASFSFKTWKSIICRIVGDNIDYHINARYQSKQNTNQSIHWTQQYAILDRMNKPLNNTRPQKPFKDIQLIDLLPVKEVQDMFKKNCAVLVSRIITKHLGAFKHMQDLVIRHIPHDNSHIMSQKSELVSKP